MSVGSHILFELHINYSHFLKYFFNILLTYIFLFFILQKDSPSIDTESEESSSQVSKQQKPKRSERKSNASRSGSPVDNHKISNASESRNTVTNYQALRPMSPNTKQAHGITSRYPSSGNFFELIEAEPFHSSLVYDFPINNQEPSSNLLYVRSIPASNLQPRPMSTQIVRSKSSLSIPAYQNALNNQTNYRSPTVSRLGQYRRDSLILLSPSRSPLVSPRGNPLVEITNGGVLVPYHGEPRIQNDKEIVVANSYNKVPMVSRSYSTDGFSKLYVPASRNSLKVPKNQVYTQNVDLSSSYRSARSTPLPPNGNSSVRYIRVVEPDRLTPVQIVERERLTPVSLTSDYASYESNDPDDVKIINESKSPKRSIGLPQ